MTIRWPHKVAEQTALFFLIGLFTFESHGSRHERDNEDDSRYENDSSSSDLFESNPEHSKTSVKTKGMTPQLNKRFLKSAGQWSFKIDKTTDSASEDPRDSLLSESGKRRRSIEEETQDVETPHPSSVFDCINKFGLSLFEKEDRLSALQQQLNSLSLSAELRNFVQQLIDTIATPDFYIPINSTFMTLQSFVCLSENLKKASGDHVINDDYNRDLLSKKMRQYLTEIDKDVVDIVIKRTNDTLVYREEKLSTFNITDLNFLFSELDVTNIQACLSVMQDVPDQEKIADALMTNFRQILLEMQQRDEWRLFFAPVKDSFQQVNSPFAQALETVLHNEKCLENTDSK